MDQVTLTDVRDEVVPEMLFLSVNPTTVEEQNLPAASTPTYIDGGGLGTGSVFPTTVDIPTTAGSDSTDRLLTKLRAALKEKSIIPVRQELQLRLLKLTELKLHNDNNLSTLESNFSDESDQLSLSEEEVLEFTEIFERLMCKMPQQIKKNFDQIVMSKKIPFQKPEGCKKKTFFVYAENKILMKVCHALSSLEVYHMYKILRESKEVESDDNMKDFLSQPCPPPQDLDEVAGLKDVAFYHLVLSLMRKKMMNRLYTHNLTSVLNILKVNYVQSEVDYLHIDRAISYLNRYPIVSQPPGLCIIFIMMKDRVGAEKDLKLVKNLFQDLFMYDVFVKMDPQAKDIKHIICKLKAARNKFYDSLVVWFMGHGSKSYLNVQGGEIHRRVELIEPFTEIEWFCKKPKLFFIQACAIKKMNKRLSTSLVPERGLPTKTDALSWKALGGEEWNKKYGEFQDVSTVNSFADTLISYATIWYQPAARDEKGSLYVDTLVDQLKKYGSKESIENVLRRVHYNVNTVSLLKNVPGMGEVSWKQAPYFESSLQKEFIFPKTPNS